MHFGFWLRFYIDILRHAAERREMVYTPLSGVVYLRKIVVYIHIKIICKALLIVHITNADVAYAKSALNNSSINTHV